MAKKKTLFECQACGFQSPRWMGKCTSCNQWETMIELSTDQIKFLKETSGSSSSGSALSKAIPILRLTKTPVTMGVYIGLIMLGGIVVNSAIILVTLLVSKIVPSTGHGLVIYSSAANWPPKLSSN